MQRIHPCALTPEEYAAEKEYLRVEAEKRCPRCGGGDRLHRHGSYERGVTTAAGAVIRISVARFLCIACRGTVSYLPGFALSYRVVQAATVEAYLAGVRGRADVERWLEVLGNYARRMRANGADLLREVGGGFGRGPPEGTPLWAWLREACGSFAAATRRLSVRLSLFSEMSAAVRMKLFTGAFPVYAYMYAVRPFMRINGNAKEVEAFVLAVSGQHLSVREIELLARGYFRGSDTLRAQIRSGHVALPLQQLREMAAGSAGCTDLEGAVLRDLEVTQKYMLRVLSRSDDERLQSGAFQAQAQLLTGGILSRARGFLGAVRRLHDRGRPA